jgi:hypothetical protein
MHRRYGHYTDAGICFALAFACGDHFCGFAFPFCNDRVSGSYSPDTVCYLLSCMNIHGRYVVTSMIPSDKGALALSSNLHMRCPADWWRSLFNTNI